MPTPCVSSTDKRVVYLFHRRGKAAAFKRRKAALERQIFRKKKEQQLIEQHTKTIGARIDKLSLQLSKSQGHNLR